jgi:hypothetical protein
MCLRLVFLLITRVASWLRLSGREEAWKTAEILILRHQLTVLQRNQPPRPNLNWADRALLAALLGAIPKTRRHRLRLLVTGHDRALAPRPRPPPLGRPVHTRQDRPPGDSPEHSARLSAGVVAARGCGCRGNLGYSGGRPATWLRACPIQRSSVPLCRPARRYRSRRCRASAIPMLAASGRVTRPPTTAPRMLPAAKMGKAAWPAGCRPPRQPSPTTQCPARGAPASR